MQLNGKVVRGVRSVRSFWISLLAIIFGVVFIGFGVYFFVSDQAKTYEDTTATITEVNSEMIGNDENFYVIISYTDKKGNNHSNIRLDAYNTSWSVGKDIEIKYNVDDPNDVRTNAPAFILPLVFVGLGAISAITGIYFCVKTVKSIKKRKKVNSSADSNKNMLTNNLHAKKLTNTKLFFHFCGKMNQSYCVEDKNKKHLYECKLTKFNPIASNKYEFTDLMSGSKTELKIGKTITSSSSEGMIFVGDVLSSSFKIDGVNCWDYIADKGYEVKHFLQGKAIFRYEVVKNNKVVANIIPASIKDPFNENSANILRMGHGCYRLEIIDAYLEDVVMIAFIISRTEIVE